MQYKSVINTKLQRVIRNTIINSMLMIAALITFIMSNTITAEAKVGYRTCSHTSVDITSEILNGADWTWGNSGALEFEFILNEDRYIISGSNLRAPDNIGINGVWSWDGYCEWNDDGNDNNFDDRCHASALKQVHYFGSYCPEIGKYVIDSFAEVVICPRHSARHSCSICGDYYVIYEAPNFPDDYNHAGAKLGDTYEHYVPYKYKVNYYKGNTNQNPSMPPATNHIYDSTGSLASFSSSQGRQYTINFNVNSSSKTNPESVSSRTGSLTFNKWKIGNTYYNSGASVINLMTPTNDSGYLNAYAQWNSKTENNFSNVSRTGYTFNGWYDNASGGNKITSITISPATTAYNTTLYAHWTPITYTVIFNKNKPSTASSDVQGTMNNQSFTYDSAQKLRANTYKLKHWVFIGWNTKPDGSGTWYSNGAYVNNLTATNNGEVYLYAQWKYNQAPTIDTGTSADYYRTFYTGQTITEEMLMYDITATDDCDVAAAKNNLHISKVELINKGGGNTRNKNM